MLSTSTLVTTAEGTVHEFGDFASKFIVRHPKTSAIVAAILGGAIVHLLRL